MKNDPNTYFSGCPILLLHIHQDAAIENYNYLGNGILYSWSYIVSVGSTFSTNGKMSYCSKASELYLMLLVQKCNEWPCRKISMFSIMCMFLEQL